MSANDVEEWSVTRAFTQDDLVVVDRIASAIEPITEGYTVNRALWGIIEAACRTIAHIPGQSTPIQLLSYLKQMVDGKLAYEERKQLMSLV
jgi:hypothetical protein